MRYTISFCVAALALCYVAGAEAFTLGPQHYINHYAASDDAAAADRAVHVATDNAGTWVAVWYSQYNLGGATGTERDIIASTSTDGGATWSNAVLVNSTGASDNAGDYSPTIATDGHGQWICIWRSDYDLHGIGTDEDIFYATSQDNGLSWDETRVLNSTAAIDGNSLDVRTFITSDVTGTWIATWYSNYDLGGIGTDDDIFFARSTDNGETWSETAVLNTTASTDGTAADQASKVVYDGNGVWMAIWESRATLGDTIGTDEDILCATSLDGGVTWGAPVVVNSNAGVDENASDYEPQLATDGSGAWLAVWASNYKFGGVGAGDYDTVFARSEDNGATWSAAQRMQPYDIVTRHDEFQQIATNGHGDWIAMWTRRNNSSTPIFGGSTGLGLILTTSEDDGATWSNPRTIDASAGRGLSVENNYPNLVLDSSGKGIVAWQSAFDLSTQSNRDLDIHVITIDGAVPGEGGADGEAETAEGDGAEEGGAEGNMEGGGEGGSEGGIDGAVDGAIEGGEEGAVEGGNEGTIEGGGEVTLVVGNEVPVNHFANVDASADSDEQPSLAIGQGGVMVSIWSSTYDLAGIGQDRDILASTSTDGGATWSNAVVVNPGAQADTRVDYTPSLATDGNGLWVCAWTSDNGNDNDIYYATSSDNGVSWSAGGALNSTHAADVTATDFSPHVSTDRAGTWLVTWASEHNLGGSIGTDLDILFARSTDGGDIWSGAAVLNSNAADDGTKFDQSPRAAADGSGNWVVLWDSNNSLGIGTNNDTEILASRSPDGGLTWTAPTPVNPATTDGITPDREAHIATDRAGVWLAAWSQNSGGYRIVYARSEDNGATWSGALPLAQGGSGNHLPHMATDGHGNWVAAWHRTTFSGGFLNTSQAHTAQISFSRDNGLSWSEALSIDAATAANELAVNARAQVTLNGAGRGAVVWHSTYNLNDDGTEDRDVHAVPLYLERESQEGAIDGEAEPAEGDGAGSEGEAEAMEGEAEAAEGEAEVADGEAETTDGEAEVAEGEAEPTPNTTITIRRGTDPDHLYTPGESLIVVTEFKRHGTGAVAPLRLIETLPTGWTFAARLGGPRPNVMPEPGAGGDITFEWTMADDFSFNLIYLVDVPASSSGTREISGYAEYGIGGFLYTSNTYVTTVPQDAPPVANPENTVDVALGEEPAMHSLDVDINGTITLRELLRGIQLYNAGGISCGSGEDGYDVGVGLRNCTPHAGDYTPQDWTLSMSELLRLVQYYNLAGYYACGGTEDGFCLVK